jgi:hypothetical protein
MKFNFSYYLEPIYSYRISPSKWLYYRHVVVLAEGFAESLDECVKVFNGYAYNVSIGFKKYVFDYGDALPNQLALDFENKTYNSPPFYYTAVYRYWEAVNGAWTQNILTASERRVGMSGTFVGGQDNTSFQHAFGETATFNPHYPYVPPQPDPQPYLSAVSPEFPGPTVSFKAESYNHLLSPLDGTPIPFKYGLYLPVDCKDRVYRVPIRCYVYNPRKVPAPPPSSRFGIEYDRVFYKSFYIDVLVPGFYLADCLDNGGGEPPSGDEEEEDSDLDTPYGVLASDSKRDWLHVASRKQIVTYKASGGHPKYTKIFESSDYPVLGWLDLAVDDRTGRLVGLAKITKDKATNGTTGHGLARVYGDANQGRSMIGKLNVNGKTWAMASISERGQVIVIFQESDDAAKVKRRISRDGGETWEPTPELCKLDDAEFSKRVISVTADPRLNHGLIGTFKNGTDATLARSGDGGLTWHKVLP